MLGECGHLPEALKGQRDNVLLAFQATGQRSARMVAKPPKHDRAEAVLRTLPCVLITLYGRTAEEFKPIGLVAWLTPARGLQFQMALFCKDRIAQRVACPFLLLMASSACSVERS